MMTALAYVVLAVGIGMFAVGCRRWRSYGKGLVLTSGIQASTMGALVAPDDYRGFRYALLAIAAALIVTSLASGRRDTWRLMRLEAILAGATIAAIVASMFLTGPLETVSGVLVIALGFAFLTVAVFRLVPALVTATGRTKAS